MALTKDPCEVLDSLPDDVQVVVMALSIIMKRIESLPKPDREDLFALTREWEKAGTEEELLSIRRAMREILAQTPVTARPLPKPRDAEGLEKWAAHVGAKIRALREVAGLSQVQLAEKAGIPQPHLSRLERAEHSATHKTLVKIATALGVDVGKIDPCLDD